MIQTESRRYNDADEALNGVFAYHALADRRSSRANHEFLQEIFRG
jgi:hypothetical protein